MAILPSLLRARHSWGRSTIPRGAKDAAAVFTSTTSAHDTVRKTVAAANRRPIDEGNAAHFDAFTWQYFKRDAAGAGDPE